LRGVFRSLVGWFVVVCSNCPGNFQNARANVRDFLINLPVGAHNCDGQDRHEMYSKRKSTVKFNTLPTLAAAVLTAFAGTAMAEKWDMPMAYAATNYHSEHGVMFADKVKEYTDGGLEITVHAGGSLFGGADIKRAIQTGQAPIGERIMSAHANEEPLLNWDNQPFLATTYEDSAKLWEAARDTVNETLSEMNLVALYTCPWPGQGFYFNGEVSSAADVKGMKLRSYNAATATVIESLGGTPVQIEAAELTQALATGVADGFISSGSTM